MKESVMMNLMQYDINQDMKKEKKELEDEFNQIGKLQGKIAGVLAYTETEILEDITMLH